MLAGYVIANQPDAGLILACEPMTIRESPYIEPPIFSECVSFVLFSRGVICK